MNSIREIASAYYERASQEEKGLARAYFEKLDVNGDGKISLQEFKNGVSMFISADQDVFKKLDANGDGYLNFDEALGLYYMEKMKSMKKCSGCRDLLVGPYFSCKLCLVNIPNKFDLCCACYRWGKFKHHHSLSNFLDNRSLLKFLLKTDLHKNREKNDIKELGEIAIAHYRAGAPEVQSLARKFFDSMDTDGDGKIDLPEFLAFMKQEGHVRMQNPYFFKELDMDGNGTLDFHEVMTIYYIIKSGRPFCDACGNFIPGIFFSCVECFKNPKNSFNLCRDCYCSKKCNHKHNGRSQFLDNYTLLEAKRDSALARETGVNRYERINSGSPLNPKPTNPFGPFESSIPSNASPLNPKPRNAFGLAESSIPSNAIVPAPSNAIVPAASNNNIHVNTYVVNRPPISSSYAIVPSPSNAKNNWSAALRALEIGLGIGSITATLCTIL